jgi:dTDP-4-amino-4,6-dideoxygalactose transaminase
MAAESISKMNGTTDDDQKIGSMVGGPGEIPFIDLSRQYNNFRYEIKLAIDRVLTSGIYAIGEEAELFENEFADYCGAEECISVSSGMKALEIGLAALGVGPGDEVVTVANAGMHSTAAIRAIGALPRFSEIDPISLTMSPEGLQEAITPQTKAVIVTHLYGRVADLPAITKIVKAHDLMLLEDCFQANGASVNGKPVGTWGDAGCFCFAPAKTLGALGEAGAIITSEGDTAESARRIRKNGDNSARDAHLEWSKSNFMDEIQAAILRVKLPLLQEWNLNRRMISQAYRICFDDMAEMLNCPSQVNGSVFQHYVIRTEQRDLLREWLSQHGIGTTVHYPAPDYAFLPHQFTSGLPETEKACAQVLSLPCYPELNQWEIERVSSLVLQGLDEVVRRSDDLNF